MKTVGIALLFGLCCMIGYRLGAKRTERLRIIRTLIRDLGSFSERIGSGRGTLKEIASEQNRLAEMIDRYLRALSDGKKEQDAVNCAVDMFREGSPEQDGMRSFFSGLSAVGRSDILKRTNVLSNILEKSEEAAEAEAKQAGIFRVSGVLIGAGIAILLI